MSIDLEGWLAKLSPGWTLIGTSEADERNAKAEGDILYGLAGDDRLQSQLNRTALIGGLGRDELSADAIASPDRGLVVLSGDEDDDILTARLGAVEGLSTDVVVAGGTGNDSISAEGYVSTRRIPSSGTERQIVTTWTDGGDGDDAITATADTSRDSFGGTARNIAFGGLGNDHITASAKGAQLSANESSSNMIDGGDGDDTITASAFANGNDDNFASNQIIGGNGNDAISSDTRTGSNSSSARAVSEIRGGAGNDFLQSNQSTTGESAFSEDSTIIHGEDGNDIIVARSDINSRSFSGGAVLSSHELDGGASDDDITSSLYATTGFSGFANVTAHLVGGSGSDRLNSTLVLNQQDGPIYLLNELDGGVGRDSLTALLSVTAVPGGVAENSLQGGDDDDVLEARLELSEYTEFPVLMPYQFGFNRLEGGEGNDTLSAYVSWLTAPSETLVYGTSLLNGGAGADSLTVFGGSRNILDGGSGNDMLRSGTGDDLLDGGAGADRMLGGAGNDTYTVDNAGDTVGETYSDGTDAGGLDRVDSAVSFALGTYVENLTLTGTAAITASGNALANTLIGNSGANALYGYGGADWLDGGLGADRMLGGAGNDTYTVDNAGDTVGEAYSDGTDAGGLDRVNSAVSFALGTYVENLTLTGTAAITASGNALANTLIGNSGANALYGYGGADWLDGGAGADRMLGGAGNDTYTVDNAGDTVGEAYSDGTDAGGLDRVNSAVSFALGTYVENLTLTGTAAINASGNGLANTLIGNSGANLLNGAGAADVLTGNAGADTFAFSTALGSTNIDRITDFVVIDDTIQLARSIFAAVGPGGQLAETAFRNLATGAVDASDRILYNSATGSLSYDADGSGAASTAVQFAILDTRPTLTHVDFFVV